MLILFLLLAPAALIFAAQKVPLLDRIGVVPLAFVLGALVSFLRHAMGAGIGPAQNTLAEVSVALALPLIIFSASLHKALLEARGAALAFALALVSVTAMSLIGALLFAGRLPELWQVAGMAAGVYSGGSVNMGAIKTAIGASDGLFVTMITYDIVFSVVYMLVLLLAGQRLAGLFLRPFDGAMRDDDADFEALSHLTDETAHGYRRVLSRENLPGSALVLLAAGLTVAISVAIAQLFPPAAGSVVTILAITTLGIAGSLMPALHRVRTSFHLGMYLILVFCLTTAAMLDPSIFTAMDWRLAGYFLFVIFGSLILQGLLSRLFNIDRDTFLIASGAAIMSVPFIPVIVGALKNRALLIPGIAIAILGYAFGTYLGIAVAEIVRRFTG